MHLRIIWLLQRCLQYHSLAVAYVLIKHVVKVRSWLYNCRVGVSCVFIAAVVFLKTYSKYFIQAKYSSVSVSQVV